VDIALMGGQYVVLLKDLGNVKVVRNQIIRRGGQQIGNVTGGTADGFDMLKGLHFALIRAEYYKDYRDLTPHTVDATSRRPLCILSHVSPGKSFFIEELMKPSESLRTS
jgi:hypothetical protein